MRDKQIVALIAALVLLCVLVLSVYIGKPSEVSVSELDSPVYLNSEIGTGENGSETKSPPIDKMREEYATKYSTEVLKSIRNTEQLARDFERFHGVRGILPEVLKSLDIEARFVDASYFFGVDPQQGAEVSFDGEGHQLIRILLDDGGRITFRSADRELLSYIGEYRTDSVPANLNRKDAITEVEARRTVKDLLDVLNLGYNISLARCILEDEYDQIENDLRGAFWKLQLEQQYMGFYTDGFVRAQVSAYSGEIETFSRFPLVIPEDMTIRISEEQAVKSVQEFASSKELAIGEVNLKDKWIIGYDPSVWNGERDGVEVAEPGWANTRPAFRLSARNATVVPNEDGVPPPRGVAPYYIFFVDCASGEVINGSGVSWW